MINQQSDETHKKIKAEGSHIIKERGWVAGGSEGLERRQLTMKSKRLVAV